MVLSFIDFNGNLLLLPLKPNQEIEKMRRFIPVLKRLSIAGFLLLNSSLVFAQTAEEYLKMGDAADDQGNLTQAMVDYNKAIDINPHLADAYNRRCIIYTKQQDLTQALSDCNKAIEINPDYAKAYSNRANIFTEQGNLIQAIADYDKAIKLNPDMAEIYCNRASLYGKQGKFAEAIPDYSKAIELNPKLGIAYNNRALGYIMLQEYDKSLDDVNKAKELGYPVNPELFEMINNAKRGRPDPSNAKITKEQAIEIAKKVIIEHEASKGKNIDLAQNKITATFNPGIYDTWTPHQVISKSKYFKDEPTGFLAAAEQIAEKARVEDAIGNGYWEVTFEPGKDHVGGLVVRVDPKTGESSGPMGLK